MSYFLRYDILTLDIIIPPITPGAIQTTKPGIKGGLLTTKNAVMAPMYDPPILEM